MGTPNALIFLFMILAIVKVKADKGKALSPQGGVSLHKNVYTRGNVRRT